MEHWSGPARALSVHLDMFAKSHRNHTWLSQRKRSSLAEFQADPNRGYWLSFAKTYSRWMPALEDGSSGSYFREPSDDEQLWTPENLHMATHFIEREHTMLDEAVTYYVSEPLTEMVTQAAHLMPGPEPMWATDPPTPRGLAIFEKPWLLPDLHPDTGEVVDDLLVPVRAVGWMTQPVTRIKEMDEKPGILFILYTDTHSYDEVYVPKVIAVDPDRYREDPEERGPRKLAMMPLDVSPWQFGLSWRNVRRVEEYTGADHATEEITPLMENVGRWRQWMLSFFRLMWQEIIVSDDPPLDRAERRRWDRAGRTLPEDGAIKVLRLRRIQRPHTDRWDRDDEHEEYRWHLNHRIIVRPFMRDQWYRSLGPAYLEDGTRNPASHRRIFIASHIRGPEDAPLVLKHDVTAVTR